MLGDGVSPLRQPSIASPWPIRNQLAASPRDLLAPLYGLRREKVALARKRAEAEPEACSNPCRWVTEETNLLAAVERAGVVFDRYLDGAISQPHELPRQLPVEIESVGDERDAFEALGPEHLEHRERVTEPGAVRHVEEPREHPMGHVHDPGDVPHLVHHAHPLSGDVAAAEGEVDIPTPDRMDQLRIVTHGVLEVGVLDQDDSARDVLEALAHRGALSFRGVL